LEDRGPMCLQGQARRVAMETFFASICRVRISGLLR
jgi:hypothetical protein